jgi:hypothetical protein
MFISKQVCEAHLEDLFELLFSPICDNIKVMIIIALGDLTRLYPNELQRHSSRLFNLLADSAIVRSTQLFIFSQLVMA